MIDTLLNYNSSLTRSNIVNSLPFILSEIRNYTNQYFLTLSHLSVQKIDDGVIYLSDDPSTVFEVGDTIELMNSENNTLIYQIKEFNGNTMKLEQGIVDEKLNDKIVAIKLSFKNVNLKTISQMITYDMKFGGTSGIKSQTLGGYNVTYATPSDKGETMFPIELYGGLNSLKKLNDDYAEYRRKGYVRL